VEHFLRCARQVGVHLRLFNIVRIKIILEPIDPFIRRDKNAHFRTLNRERHTVRAPLPLPAEVSGGRSVVRTFAQEVKHVAASNYFLFASVTGEKILDDFKEGNGAARSRTRSTTTVRWSST